MEAKSMAKGFSSLKTLIHCFYFCEIEVVLVNEEYFPRTYVFASDINQIVWLLHSFYCRYQ